MRTIAVNRRAQFDYEISDRFTAGIQLTGHEAKSAKLGRLDITGASVIFRKGEAFLVGAEIASFQPKNIPSNFQQGRTRKLLLNKKETRRLIGKTQESNLTVIALNAYISDRDLIKVELGLAKKRKKHDKREIIRKREVKREIRKSFKGG